MPITCKCFRRVNNILTFFWRPVHPAAIALNAMMAAVSEMVVVTAVDKVPYFDLARSETASAGRPWVAPTFRVTVLPADRGFGGGPS
jgi:hypothetical protein